MLSKNEVKYIQSLYHKKNRGEESLFIVQGEKLAEELLANNYSVKKIYAVIAWIQNHPQVDKVIEVSADELKKISSHQSPNQVLVIASQKKLQTEPQLISNLSLVLDGIQDPGNFGTILRTADWFGIKQIIASEDSVDFYNDKVIQSTMGSFMRVNVWYKQLGDYLRHAGVPIYGALLKGNDLYQSKKIKEGLLVIGNEAKGIRESLKGFIEHPLTIPRKGGAESLNAAVATGIMLSHLV